MKDYGWKETEDYFMKVVRPAALFDLSSLKYPEPGHKENYATAIHRLSGERETYALLYGKGHNLKLLKTRMSNSEPWLERDREDLRRLKTKTKIPTTSGHLGAKMRPLVKS